MNYEIIQSFLNTPISELMRDEFAIGQAKENLKKYESFNSLLKDRLELFKQCEKICSLELLESLPANAVVDRSYILGFKQGLKSLELLYNKYQDAFNYLHKEGA